MQYDVNTPEEYLQQLPNDWRKEKVLTLREILKDCAPNMHEKINYKMLSYCDGNDIVLCLNAQKNYVSLYVGNASKIDKDGTMLKGLNVGKGCIRFSKSVAISDTRIDEFIKRTVQMRENGEDFDC